MGLMLKADPERAHRGRRPHLQMGAEEALSEDAARARQEQHAVAASSCRSASPRPIRSSRSPNTSAAGRCSSCRTNGCRAPRRCSRNSPTTCRAQEPRSWLAGGKRMLVDRIEWIVMPDPGHRRGRAAERRGRLVGEPDLRPRAAADARTATSRSTSPTRSATSARSA